MSKKNPDELTDDEKAFLKSSAAVPDEVREFVSRQHDTIGTRVGAYRKVAAAAKAEADAILAARLLEQVHGEATDLADARRDVLMARREAKQLRGELAEKNRQVVNATARPALAVHSDD